MADLDVIEKVSDLVGLAYTRPNRRQENWKQSYKMTIRGHKAVEIMRAVYAFMSVRRRAQIPRALAVINLKLWAKYLHYRLGNPPGRACQPATSRVSAIVSLLRGSFRTGLSAAGFPD
jgi:hypothetical protein